VNKPFLNKRPYASIDAEAGAAPLSGKKNQFWSNRSFQVKVLQQNKSPWRRPRRNYGHSVHRQDEDCVLENRIQLPTHNR
jgi:hypothetical protein